MSNLLKYGIAAIAIIIFGISLFNASWIADAPEGDIALVGHGQWELPSNKEGCIIDPQLAYNEKYYNADIRSLRTIAAYDADAISIDSTLEGGKLLIPQAANTGCARDLKRPRSTIDKAIESLSGLSIYLPIKNGEDDKADALIAAIKGKKYDNKIYAYGDDALSQKIAATLPNVDALPVNAARQCVQDYKTSGWYGNVPASCNQGKAIILMSDSLTLWGWPNRLMQRFAEKEIEIIIAKDIQDGKLIGLNDVNSYGDIPDTFVGTIWIDDIENLGPALIR